MNAGDPPPRAASAASAAWHGRRRETGLLVIGHGTADPVGAEETRILARLVAARLPGVPTELGFLEVIGPSIDEACAALSARGCTAAVAAPLLLFTAGHARRDVPEALAAAARAHGIAVAQSAAFGIHPAIVALSRQRRMAAVAALPAVPADETVLVVIGRGSSAPDAVDQLRAFVAAASAVGPQPASVVELGFVAAARPTADEALARGVARGPRRIIVQPHLLFHGHVEHEVVASVGRFRAMHPAIEWVVVPRLGADDLVADAVIERAQAALDGDFVVPESPFPAGKNVSPEPP
jgi:sirohydrochlorin cobaltochelatase